MQNPDRIHVLPWSLGLLVLCALLSGCASPKSTAPHWARTAWNGEAAWLSDAGDWRAIVSEHRARLIYLGPKDGKTNLLYAPLSPGEFRPRGGHLFWLGPQSEWTGKWGSWPPPDEWEQQPARLAEVEGDALHLTLPRPDETLPQLKRSYRWIGDTLHCRVAWSGGQGDHQAVQILQLPPQAVVEARCAPETTPGFVHFDTTGKQGFASPALGENVTRLSGETLRLESRGDPAKYGFPPCTLHARLGAYSLDLGRGAVEGTALKSPDHGYDTQVYLGGNMHPFVEIEQLTPRLQNQGTTETAFTIWIKPGQL